MTPIHDDIFARMQLMKVFFSALTIFLLAATLGGVCFHAWITRRPLQKIEMRLPRPGNA